MPEPLTECDEENSKSALSQRKQHLVRERSDLRNTLRFANALALTGITGWIVGVTQCILTIVLEGDNTGLMLSGAAFNSIGSLSFFLSVKTRQGAKTLYPFAWKEREFEMRAHREMKSQSLRG